VKLTHMQTRVALAIEEFTESAGRCPTLDELREYAEVEPHKFRDIYRSLVRKGAIREEGGKVFVVEPIDPPESTCKRCGKTLTYPGIHTCSGGPR
jgi:DNA-binding transcriptional regulator YhcF (GntR family)